MMRAPRLASLVLALMCGTTRAQDAWPAPLPVQGDSTLAPGADTMALTARKQLVDIDLEAAQSEYTGVEARLAHDGRVLYRLKRSGLLPVAGGVAAMLTHASRVGRLERIVVADLAAKKRLAERVQALREEQAALSAQLEKTTRDQGILAAARADADRQTFMSAFKNREPAAPPARASSGYGLSMVGGSGSENGSDRFTDQRGRLAMPVSGSSRIEDTTRAESDGAGLALSSERGSGVRAAASGRVVFAERYGSYGQLVVLDHGDRYFTVYGGLAEVEVQVGDELSKSARLGSAGSEPVYFEVRRGTRAQDARRWLGL